MKKILSIIFATLLVISCFNSCKNEHTNKENEEESEVNSISQLDEELCVPDSGTIGFWTYRDSKLRFFISKFLLRNPDCFNNEISREHYSNILKKELDSIIAENDTFINDLTVYDIERLANTTDIATRKKEGFMVALKGGDGFATGFSSNDKFDYTIYFTIVGNISKEEYMKIEKEYQAYKISGKIHKRTDDDPYGYNFGIKEDYGRSICLGSFIIRDLELTKEYE